MGRSDIRLAEARSALEAIDAPGLVSTVSGDVANETDVEQAIDSARLEGSLDILVASAGRVRCLLSRLPMPMVEMT